MSDLATIYERNEAFAASFDDGDLPIKPNLSTIILSCVDARVDPTRFAGLALGDALVMRTIGARVTETAMTEIAALWQLMKLGLGTDPMLGLAIIHHTQCGMTRFAQPEVATKLNEVFGSPRVVDTYAIADSRSAIETDVERALGATDTPPGLTISGHLYDLPTGRLEEIVPPVVAA